MLRSALLGLSVVLTVAAVPVNFVKAETLNPEAVQEFQVSQATVSEVASGTFTTVEQDHPTSGTAQIIREGEQHYLVFSSDFTTATGPDVQVILYRGSSVPVNLAEGSYETIATLQSFDGGQSYIIPTGTDLSEFGAVGIWCRQFNVTFGYAAL